MNKSMSKDFKNAPAGAFDETIQAVADKLCDGDKALANCHVIITLAMKDLQESIFEATEILAMYAIHLSLGDANGCRTREAQLIKYAMDLRQKAAEFNDAVGAVSVARKKHDGELEEFKESLKEREGGEKAAKVIERIEEVLENAEM